ncbi:MAG: phosphodiester glycosidase family protein [Bacteroidota bacterium]
MHLKTKNKILWIYSLFLFLPLFSTYSQPQSISWQKVDSGLFFTETLSPIKSDNGDSKVTILKIDPHYYSFKLLSAKETKEDNKTIREWVKTKELIAAINAGLYQEDDKTNVGFMKNYNFVNNNHLTKDNTVTAFNRTDATVPEIQIIDLKCQKWEDLKDKYYSFTQGIRMIDCNQNNTWSQQPDKFGMAVIAIDKQGNALFIFTCSPYSVHDFINSLKLLPLDIYNAMYLEGSSPASFYLNYKGLEDEKTGYIMANGENGTAWELPNIIGIVKKK